MRNLAILVVLVAILLGGGALTSQLFSDPPIIIQSLDPNASVFEATPQQANMLILWIGFVLFNLVGAAGTIAVLMWLGNAGVAQVRGEAANSEADKAVAER